MTEQAPSSSYPPPPAPAGQPYAAAPAFEQPPMTGYVGKQRSTGLCILLYFVTFGIYGIVWWCLVHDEMKRHTGRGLGGLVALLLALFVGIVMPFFTSDEVGKLHERIGRSAPVSAMTGLWYFPGIFILVGPFIWFAKTNGALNDYWRSQGAA